MSVLSGLLAYLLGSIPFALLVARAFGTPDLRVVGSGSLGATNVARAAGPGAGVLVAVLDIAKGALAAFLAVRWNGAGSTAAAAAGVAAVAGHVYPVWLRFRGGKGVATGCGVFAVLAPIAILPTVAVFLLSAAVTRYMSVGSLTSGLTLPIAVYATGSPTPILVAAIAVSALVIVSHRANVGRLLHGTERRLGARA